MVSVVGVNGGGKERLRLVFELFNLSLSVSRGT
jgi:hypothetical protein